MYVIYTRGKCNLCERAKEYLREKNLPFESIELVTRDDINLVKTLLPQDVIQRPIKLPIVFKNSTYIGGLSELMGDERRERIFDKKNIIDLLTDNECHVTVQKNGGIEHVTCTLMQDLLPEGVVLNQGDTGNFVTVFDLKTKTWTGFHVTAVKMITVTS